MIIFMRETPQNQGLLGWLSQAYSKEDRWGLLDNERGTGEKPPNDSENCTEKQGEPFPHFHGVSSCAVEASHNVKKLLFSL